MPTYLARTLLAVAPLFAASAAQATVAQDTADVPTLIAAYQQALKDHDGTRLAQLFVPQGSAWFTVLAAEPWARMRAAKPETPKVSPGSVKGFVQMVSKIPVPLESRHDNMRVTSDGEIATVTFNFRFLINNKIQNRGAESWQLIHGADGWRIVSIVFSSTPTT